MEELPHTALGALVELFRANRHAELEATALDLAAKYPRSARLLHLLAASRLTRGLSAEAPKHCERPIGSGQTTRRSKISSA